MREGGGGTWSERLAVRGAVKGGGGGTWSERLAVRGSSERRRRRNMV